MATLTPSINLCSTTGCKNLAVYDTTGFYHPVTNPGGYGSPNPETTDLEIDHLTITLPDGTTYDVASLVGDHPLDTPDVAMATVSNVDLGLDPNAQLDDGIYTVEYVLNNVSSPIVGESTYTVTCYILITCQVNCCIDEKIEDLDPDSCGCDDNDITRQMIAILMLKGAKASAKCGDLAAALAKFEFVQNYCSFEECKTCE